MRKNINRQPLAGKRPKASLSRDYRYLSRSTLPNAPVVSSLSGRPQRSHLLGFVIISLFVFAWLASPFKEVEHANLELSSQGEYSKGLLNQEQRSQEQADLQVEEVESASSALVESTSLASVVPMMSLSDKAPPVLPTLFSSKLSSDLAKRIAATHLISTAEASVEPIEAVALDSEVELAMLSPDLISVGNADSEVNHAPSANSTTNPGAMKSFRIKKGDTLSELFNQAGLPLVTAYKLARDPQASALKLLRRGQEVRFYFDQSHQFDSLEYDITNLQTLVAVPLEDGAFQVAKHEKEVSYKTFSTSGVIKSSLSSAAEKAGIPLSLAMSLVDIFKWEIDFARDIQPEDQFRLIYQKAYVDGKVVGDGPILAAEFINNGDSVKAVRFIDDNDNAAYYSPDGDSLRRGFLRTPVELARVSSGFSKRRFHPIKKKWKEHKGVDYAAKKGTPIIATGDGTVQYAGRKNGYGKTVILRHGSKYTTLYAHMTKYGRGVRSGKRIKQGQIIGYVGSTGLATGPHLHYEFRVQGKHKNPLKVKLPKAVALEKRFMERFKSESKLLLVSLGKLSPAQLASN